MESLLYRCPHCHEPIEIEESLTNNLITCPNPDCSRPFRAEVPTALPVTDDEILPEERQEDNVWHVAAGASEEEKIIRSVHPAMFRKNPLQFAVCALAIGFGFWGLFTAAVFDTGIVLNTWELVGPGVLTWLSLILMVAGGLILGFWWVKILYTKLTITNKRTLMEQGIIARRTTEVQHDDVRNLQVHQTAIERILGVGDLAISSSGQDELEILAVGMPEPDVLANIIRDMQ